MLARAALLKMCPKSTAAALPANKLETQLLATLPEQLSQEQGGASPRVLKPPPAASEACSSLETHRPVMIPVIIIAPQEK